MESPPVTFINWYKNHFVGSTDLIDVFAVYDRKLSIEENKNIFMDKFAIYYIEGNKEVKDKLEQLEAQKNEIVLAQRIYRLR